MAANSIFPDDTLNEHAKAIRQLKSMRDLKDLFAAVQADADLTASRRRDILSAIGTSAHWFGTTDLTAIPANRAFLRDAYRRFHPKQLAKPPSKKRVANVRSEINFALSRYGLREARPLTPMSEPWKALWAKLPGKYERTCLSRLFRWASANGIDPLGTKDGVATRFLEYLTTETLTKVPREAHKNALRAWNRCVRSIDGWPQAVVTEPSYKNCWGLPWSEFPELHREVDGFFGMDLGATFFDETKPHKLLKPKTIATQTDHLRCLASAVVRQGHATRLVTSLAYLAHPSHAQAALQFFLDRYQEQPSGYVAAVAWTLRTIALYGVTPEAWEAFNRQPYDKGQHEKEKERIVWLERRIASRTKKSRERFETLLAQFEDPAAKQRSLQFPFERFATTLSRDRGGLMDSIDAQYCAALALWPFAPLRLDNLLELRLDHLRWVDQDSECRVIIHVPPDIVKNAKALAFEIPPHAAVVLRTYIDRFRPRLIREPNPYVFPGEKPGERKRPQGFRTKVKKLIWDGTGLRFHPHAIRSIVTKIFLDAHPAEISVMQRILGHASERTTIKSYTSAQQRAAQRVYHRVILGFVSGEERP